MDKSLNSVLVSRMSARVKETTKGENKDIWLENEKGVLTYATFEAGLKRAELNKKEFSTLSNTPYQTIMGWQRSGKTPAWVYSWLVLYLNKNFFDNFIMQIEGDESGAT